MLNFNETQTLPNIELPVLVIAGQSDISTLKSANRRISMDIPNAEFFVLKPGGHMALMERNAEFAQAVQMFGALQQQR